MPMIPCLTWVRRGVTKQIPDRVEVTKDELEKIIKNTREDIDDLKENEEEDHSNLDHDGKDGATSEMSHKKSKKKRKKEEDSESDTGEDVVSKYGLEDYDEEEEDEDDDPLDIGGLCYYANNDDDPHFTVKDANDSDAEDDEIRATDNLLVVGNVKEDSCDLNIYVYNEIENHFFIHHDIILPSFPLALEWMNYDPGEAVPGNLLAVGSMEPTVDIWDLDVMDTLEPSFVLGEKPKKKLKKKKTSSFTGHSDAVLALSWNQVIRTALASASADSTVALWDLTKGTVATTLTQHTDKVQAVQWHPVETQSLLTGGFDKTVKVFDCRNPDETHKSWKVNGEVETVLWNKFSPMYFLASMDDGNVCCFDVRKDKPVYTLSAHTSSVTGLALSSQVPGLLVTSSEDKSFKVWDVLSNTKPQHVFSKDMKLGKIFSMSSCPDAAYVFAIGGEQDLKVWDIREVEAVRSHFDGRSSSVPCQGSDGTPGDQQSSQTLDAMSSLSLSPDTSSKPESAPSKKKKPKKKKKGKQTTS